MASEESIKNNDWAGTVKWLVLGAIALTFMFLYRPEIGRLLERTVSIGVSKDGFEIQTTKTVLGEVEVSNVTEDDDNVLNGGFQNSYVSLQDKFKISWPGNEGWSASETEGRAFMKEYKYPATIDIPLIIKKIEKNSDFRPNVNVVMETVDNNMTINDYMDNSIVALNQQPGWKLLSRDTDEKTQGGFITFYNNNNGNKLYQFQRMAMANGKAYVITASQLPPNDSLSIGMKEELLSIINSFRIIK